jgi:signal transduction histidine kinase
MRLAIRTHNRAIAYMCRQSLRTIGLDSCELIELGVHTKPCDRDIEIRDFQSSTGPSPSDCGGRTVFIYLVERADIDQYLFETASRAWAVLQPVSTPTLTSALRHAIEMAQSGNLAGITGSRAAPVRSSARAFLDLQIHDQNRTRFLARAAHDLKGPLSVIAGYCGLLLSGDAGKLGRRQKHAITTMQKSVERLNRIAQDFFDLSARASVDNIRPMQVGDINQVLADYACDLAATTNVRRIRLSTLLDICQEPVAYDRTGIERVMMNLIENACRFTPVDGSITLRGYSFFWERRERRSPILIHCERRTHNVRLPNCYRVDVHNTGPRIPDESMPRIFEEYITAGETPDRYSAGLGLAICRSILVRHAGQIWAENRSDGPVFSFVIPFARKTRQAIHTVAVDGKLLSAGA